MNLQDKIINVLGDSITHSSYYTGLLQLMIDVYGSVIHINIR